MAKKIVYRLNVNVTLPLTEDAQHPDFYTLEQATSQEMKRQVERSLYNWLKRWDYESDVELMDFSVEDE